MDILSVLVPKAAFHAFGIDDKVLKCPRLDPAERSVFMRLLYQNKRPTRLGRWFNRINCWWSGLGLPPR